jgi:prepilin-type processing-associated H-X9-DG protein
MRLEYTSYRTFRVPHLNTGNYSAYDGHVASLQRRYYQMGAQGASAATIEAALPFKF